MIVSAKKVHSLQNSVDRLNVEIGDIRREGDAMSQRLLKDHPFKVWQGKDGKWYTHLPDDNKKEKRKLVKRNSREDLEIAIIEYWEAVEDNPTLGEIFNEWNDRRQRIGKITIETKQRYGQVWNQVCGDIDGLHAKDVTELELSDWLEEIVAKYNLTSKAYCNVKTLVRGTLKRAVKRGYILFDVGKLFSNVDLSETNFKRKVIEDKFEVYDIPETETMMGYLTENQDDANLALLLLFVTGIRVSEVVALKREDIEDDCIHIRRIEVKYQDETNPGKYIVEVVDRAKTEKGLRTVVVPKEYSWLLTKIRHLHPFCQDGWVFHLLRSDERITTQSVRSRLRRLCKKLGIIQKSPHKIRKTYGTILLDAGMDKKLVQQQMGHTNILTTEKHYHRDRRSIERKQDLLSTIPDFKNGGNFGS